MSEEVLKELEGIRQTFTESQKEAYELAMKGWNLFLTGGPGTGKSFLTKALIKGFESMGKSVLVMAPTGIAAVNIGGTTIHRALGLKRGEIIKEGSSGIRGKKCPLLDSADVVIIDEISMVRRDLFEYVSKCIYSTYRRLNKKIQLIVVGDFFQLPPVMTPESKELLERYYKPPIGRAYCFTSGEWAFADFKPIELKEYVRQKDKEFITALNQLRLGDRICIKYLNSLPGMDDRFPYLVSTNNQAEMINKRKIEELRQRYNQGPHIFEMECEGKVKDSDLVVPREIGLYPGARIMTVINDPMGRYQNGSCGTVANIYTNGYVDVHLDNGKRNVRIKPYTWKVSQSVVDDDGKIEQEECGSYTQIPLKLAYAITIHKSQGQTYDAVNIDPDCWEAAQLYVALSRVKTPQGVHLMRPINRSAVIVDRSVVDFYKDLSYRTTAEIEEAEPEVLQVKEPEVMEVKKETKEKDVSNKKEKQSRVGRPSVFEGKTKVIRIEAESADYIQSICKKKATEGGKIRWLPEDLDICVSDALSNNVDFSKVTFMMVPLELEGQFRREIKKYEKRSDG